jgi:hypothetical protein
VIVNLAVDVLITGAAVWVAAGAHTRSQRRRTPSTSVRLTAGLIALLGIAAPLTLLAWTT